MVGDYSTKLVHVVMFVHVLRFFAVGTQNTTDTSCGYKSLRKGKTQQQSMFRVLMNAVIHMYESCCQRKREEEQEQHRVPSSQQ